MDYTNEEALISKERLNKRDDVRIFIGISGWGVGQLEREIKGGGWVVHDFSPLYFNHENLWEDLYVGKDDR